MSNWWDKIRCFQCAYRPGIDTGPPHSLIAPIPSLSLNSEERSQIVLPKILIKSENIPRHVWRPRGRKALRACAISNSCLGQFSWHSKDMQPTPAVWHDNWCLLCSELRHSSLQSYPCTPLLTQAVARTAVCPFTVVRKYLLKQIS